MKQRPYVVVTGAHGFIGNHILERMLMTDLGELQSGRVMANAPDFKPRTAQLRFSQQSEASWSSEGSEGQLTSAASSLDVWAVDLPEAAARPTAHRFAQSSRVKIVFLKQLLHELRSASHPPVAVIHNGACSSTVEKNPEVFAELNLASSQELWNFCAEFQIPFIYASSAAVYGDGSHGFSDRLEHTSHYQPLNLYGQSKLDFDRWALEQSQRPSAWFGLRYFNVYGPFESHKGGQASMVYHGYQQATRQGVIRLFKSNTPRYSDGGQLRDFVYVKDIVKITQYLLSLSLRPQQAVGTGLPRSSASVAGASSSPSKPTLTSGFVNVGTGKARSWNDLAAAVFDAIAVPKKIEYIDMPDNIAGQYQNFTCAEISTLRALGYDASMTPLEEGVRDYIQRYLMRGL